MKEQEIFLNRMVYTSKYIFQKSKFNRVKSIKKIDLSSVNTGLFFTRFYKAGASFNIVTPEPDWSLQRMLKI